MWELLFLVSVCFFCWLLKGRLTCGCDHQEYQLENPLWQQLCKELKRCKLLAFWCQTCRSKIAVARRRGVETLGVALGGGMRYSQDYWRSRIIVIRKIHCIQRAHRPWQACRREVDARWTSCSGAVAYAGTPPTRQLGRIPAW